MRDEDYKPGGLPGVPSSEGLTFQAVSDAIRQAGLAYINGLRRTETRCINDTDGDGNCAACARNPYAPCRMVVHTPSDVFEGARQQDETRAEAKGRIFRELLHRQANLPPARRLSDDVLEAGTYSYWRSPEEYATRPREYVQGWGGGLPYNTHNPWHFTDRYAMKPARTPNWQRVWMGVLKDTPMRMAQAEARHRQECEMGRLMYGSWFSHAYRVLSGRAFG
jgi:hypothetical protein